MKMFVILVVVFCFSGSGFAQSEFSENCIELLQARCQTCHQLTRVCQQLDKKSKKRWEATLKRMVKRRGATLSGQEQQVLLDCLATPDTNVKKQCEK